MPAHANAVKTQKAWSCSSFQQLKNVVKKSKEADKSNNFHCSNLILIKLVKRFDLILLRMFIRCSLSSREKCEMLEKVT